MKPLILQTYAAPLRAILVARPRPRNQSCRLVAISLAALLGLTGGWVAEQAIVPAAAHAYTSRLAVTLTAEPGETFETLLRRAESVARAAAQRSFDRDILTTDVAIIISVEHLSRVAPILTLEATRNQWKSRPDTRRWATYYRNSKTLLGMEGSSTATTTPSVTTTTSPATTPTSTPAPDSTPGATPANQPAPETTTTPDTTPTQPGNTQIIPDRIPTPAGIGK